MATENKMEEQLKLLEHQINETTNKYNDILSIKGTLKKRLEEMVVPEITKEEIMKKEEELKQLQKEINELKLEINEEEKKALTKESNGINKREDVKGSFKLSVRRERSKTAVIRLREKSHQPLAVTDYSADFENRKNTEFTRYAETISNMLKQNESISTDEIIDQLASKLNELHDELDGDSLIPDTSTAELLKTTNYESIHLRKTSTAFRVTSKIAPGDIILRDANDSDVKRFEEVILNMSEQAAAVAACSEDALCFGSLVLVNKDDNSFSVEFSVRCETLRGEVVKLFDAAKHAIDEPIVFREDSSIFVENYKSEIAPFVKLLTDSKELVKNKSIEPVIDSAMIDAFNGVGTQIKAGQVEKTFYDKALAVRALTSELIVLAGTIAKMKPKSSEECNYCDNKNNSLSSNSGNNGCITFDSKRFEKEKLLYVETSDVLIRIIDTLSSYINAVATAHKIATMQKSSTVTKETEDKDPLWEELNGSVKKLKYDEIKHTVDGGSLNRFIELLTSPGLINNDFNRVFMCSFPYFTNSKTVLQKLIERYRVPKEFVIDSTKYVIDETNSNEQSKESRMNEDAISIAKKIKVRTVIALKGLLLDAFEECDESVIEEAQCFLDNELGVNDSTKTLKEQLKRRVNERSKQITSFLIPPIDFFIPDEHISPTMLIAMMDEVEIARQLTMVDYNIYKTIQPSELYNSDVFTKNELRYRAENVMRMSDRVNEICFWVASLILSFPDLNNRAKMMTKLINVAEVLFNMNNFHSLAGIYVGIEGYSSISRLKKTRAELPVSAQKTLDKLNKWLGLESNYLLYRNHLSSLKDRCVPFISVIGKDLTFIIEGAKATFDYDVGGVQCKLINFYRHQLANEKVTDYLKFQQYPYTFPVVQPLYQYISNPLYLPDKLIYDLSLLYEPRGK
ncbi:ras guanine nucleotide exchange factor, slime mold, putative [Entamoeba dispar SAW760]|uniref:Ras guanine nucleotide exchange factor, slime mold, putative n=1 Tax=Entamoeba dispar (strain ATCC PRA-260 / SAW760) TaxID=370354 RepID=B0EUW6_ENTDS|nr:ras guanine nucleotide exchange factor, slime mold, putative [Entamoeba dispar SAW760]EDR21690.1 ras guanine nucleotide exchange factor, slime mold, putative [Entamoeba dispar SAW760]|eukprot:EDR21690.1 ras guanine nucleotide exchange factor, slime mold, putative [Entamoeba dispar SAW760]